MTKIGEKKFVLKIPNRREQRKSEVPYPTMFFPHSPVLFVIYSAHFILNKDFLISSMTKV